MKCDGCGSDKAARVQISYIEGKKWERCDNCAHVPPVWMPDVYLGSKGGIQTDENLCDSNGNPIPFSSKREKAAIMSMLKVRQANSAEKQHGSRNETKRRTYFI